MTAEGWSVLVAAVAPVVVAAYVGEKVWEHRPGWYRVPAGWRLPKVEVVCFLSVVATLAFVGVALGR